MPTETNVLDTTPIVTRIFVQRGVMDILDGDACCRASSFLDIDQYRCTDSDCIVYIDIVVVTRIMASGQRSRCDTVTSPSRQYEQKKIQEN